MSVKAIIWLCVAVVAYTAIYQSLPLDSDRKHWLEIAFMCVFFLGVVWWRGRS
jgi:hypothetical protein